MTIQVELNAEIEAQLVAEARVQGIPLEKMVERLLQEALAFRSVPRGNLTLEGFHAMLNALRRFRRIAESAHRELYAREFL
jgi:hypothetical protein